MTTPDSLNPIPTPDNPCGHALRVHDVCPRCGMLGAAEYLIKAQISHPPILMSLIEKLEECRGFSYKTGEPRMLELVKEAIAIAALGGWRLW